MKLTHEIWNQRYLNNKTGWDIGHASTPLKEYFDQLGDKNIKILIPGCGNAYEAEYLIELGFTNIYLIDWAEESLLNFKNRNPKFPSSNLICGDFFEMKGKYDLIIEQTFFCAIDPALRKDYCIKMSELLSPKGKLVGLLFNRSFEVSSPYGGSLDEYESLFKPYFNIQIMKPCVNSVLPRQGSELFIKLSKSM